MDQFFRFPHTPHIAWLGKDRPRDDKVLSPAEVDALLSEEVVIEEKVDGANLGISLDPAGGIRVQNRGEYLPRPTRGQFSRLEAWLAEHDAALRDVVSEDLILFGEWCAARHSLGYEHLPDWFLLFDIYDRSAQSFWSTSRRNALGEKAGLTKIRRITRGTFSLPELRKILETTQSTYRDGPMEGIVIRRENKDVCLVRAKLVSPNFTQAIEKHWRNRAIEWNRVTTETAGG